ncbi:hypothetical protein GIB67_014987 [Kingdonia uniflora]|uniref:Pentatricopeptide repeat-containing protein n=1 Tax=Kingdonia uniflora TaxID=39325 RepID=A0A7J7MTK0_9MAGN|nr:hypothetical protein GIB67_014987 [Kingdonia uniflora]
MITAYEQSGFSKKAIRLFREMQDNKIEFNYITMVSVISACTSLRAVSMGEWVHELVIRKRLQANMLVTNALIDINHGHGKVVLELFSNMVEEGVRPNMFTFTAVLTACRHSGLLEEGLLVEAYEFIKRMPIKLDDCVWGALLCACRVHQNLKFDELVAELVFLLDPQNTTYYILMWNMYTDASRWEDVERLKKLMNEKELKKIPGHSFVEIDKSILSYLRLQSADFILAESGEYDTIIAPFSIKVLIVVSRRKLKSEEFAEHPQRSAYVITEVNGRMRSPQVWFIGSEVKDGERADKIWRIPRDEKLSCDWSRALRWEQRSNRDEMYLLEIVGTLCGCGGDGMKYKENDVNQLLEKMDRALIDMNVSVEILREFEGLKYECRSLLMGRRLAVKEVEKKCMRHYIRETGRSPSGATNSHVGSINMSEVGDCSDHL